MDMLHVRILAPASKPDIPISSVAVLECYLENRIKLEFAFWIPGVSKYTPSCIRAEFVDLLSCPSILSFYLLWVTRTIDISDLCQSRSRTGVRGRKVGGYPLHAVERRLQHPDCLHDLDRRQGVQARWSARAAGRNRRRCQSRKQCRIKDGGPDGHKNIISTCCFELFLLQES